jgi:hypothetical protein
MAQPWNYRAQWGPAWQGYSQRNSPGSSRQPEQFDSRGRVWHSDQFDLQAYCQQLSYPQLLAPGRPQPSHAMRDVLAGLAVAVIGIRRRQPRAD